jgi:hypothetical protein
MISAPQKRVNNPDADEMQKVLYKNFPTTHFLSNPVNCDHFLKWNTFFRRNFHRFATDYLGLKLHEYQALTLYEMGVNNMIVIVASRAAAKSFIIALYACIRCILYPNTRILLSSATKGQSELIITEKIKNELMVWSPMLAREIESIKDNQNKTIVSFRNKSKITVVVANDNARGNRSNCIVREEFRQIPKNIDDSVLSPCQILRQAQYMNNDYYKDMTELKEEPVDIYISSSWFDNGNWMWKIVDNAFNQMLEGKPSCLLAFDEAVVLKHGIKSMKQLISEKRKQDPITWQLEFLNCRLKENQAAFFTYKMMQQNQRVNKPFYPRLLIDFKLGKKNPYDIPRQKNEIRILACDMAFVTNKSNDNSIFSCIRLLPESTTYNRDGGDLKIDTGYRRIVSYMESVQGGDVTKQAVRIRQLFEDFDADYICLDMRNAGIAVYDLLANIMYDEERCVEYSPLTAINNDDIKDRIRVDGAIPCIYTINATQMLNSSIALDFRRILEQKKIDFPVSLEVAREEILPQIKEYDAAIDGETQFFYESPFLETQALISETTSLIYDKKDQTGVIVIREQGNNRKDRYTSVSYGGWFATQLEKDLISNGEEYEYGTFIN